MQPALSPFLLTISTLVFVQFFLPNGVFPTNLSKTCKILTNFGVSLSNFLWKNLEFLPSFGVHASGFNEKEMWYL
jgi:hypothetical protein